MTGIPVILVMPDVPGESRTPGILLVTVACWIGASGNRAVVVRVYISLGWCTKQSAGATQVGVTTGAQEDSSQNEQHGATHVRDRECLPKVANSPQGPQNAPVAASCQSRVLVS